MKCLKCNITFKCSHNNKLHYCTIDDNKDNCQCDECYIRAQGSNLSKEDIKVLIRQNRACKTKLFSRPNKEIEKYIIAVLL